MIYFIKYAFPIKNIVYVCTLNKSLDLDRGNYKYIKIDSIKNEANYILF